MAFNDILISGAPAEREILMQRTFVIESHPSFAEFRSQYAPFKAKGLAVFDAKVIRLEESEDFRAAAAALTADLGELEARYHETVAQPASGRVLSSPAMADPILWGAAILGTVPAALIGWFLSRSITAPLDSAIRAIEKIFLKEEGKALPFGKPVDCSSHKKCGKKDCPSFGKADFRSMTSVSFAAVKHYPRAMRRRNTGPATSTAPSLRSKSSAAWSRVFAIVWRRGRSSPWISRALI